MSQAVAERAEARSKPTYLTYGELRREVFALDRYQNPVPILTETVHREHLKSVLVSAGLRNDGTLVLSRTVGKPFVWQVYSGTINTPQFPDKEEVMPALVAVSEPAYSADRTMDKKGPEYGFVVGRFTRERVPLGDFDEDLRTYFRDLIYDPRKGVAERVEGVAIAGISVGIVAALVGVGAAMSGDSNWAYYLAGGSLTVIGGAGTIGYAGTSERARIATIMSETKDADTTYAGSAVEKVITKLGEIRADVAFKRTIYEAVQGELGEIDPAKFLYHFRYPYLDTSLEDKLALSAEYAYRQNQDLPMSDLLKGTIEENTSVHRIKRGLAARH